MQGRLKGLVGAAIVIAALGSGEAEARTTIAWWHAMGGANGERVDKLARDFNASQGDYEVEPVFKGTYAETLQAAIAAFRAHRQPNLLQVFEVGTATMMAAKGAVYPVYQLMTDTGEPFDPKGYLAPVTAYYSTPDGNMLSFPFNSSTPVLWYNKDAFKKAGLDPEKPPQTWPEVESDARKLQAAGYKCGFTTSWPSWVNIENMSAVHDQPVGTLDNGFQGLGTEFVFNKGIVLHHVTKLAEWQKTKLFDYGGRTNKAAPKFYTQECAMFAESSAALAANKASIKDFAFGEGRLPYWPEVKGAPWDSIIGGASLWVMRGHPAQENKGVAKFLSYLSRPEVQAWWHQETGYLPITQAAYDLTKKSGFYAKNPGTDIAIQQMTVKAPTPNSRGIRFGNMVQIRDVIDEELESLFAGKKTPQEALDAAVKRGDTLLRQFQESNG